MGELCVGAPCARESADACYFAPLEHVISHRQQVGLHFVLLLLEKNLSLLTYLLVCFHCLPP
jgi:hypothetical protein